MNGGQDMGGVHGFGPVVEEVDEPYFHEDWERRVLGLVIAMGAAGKWNIDSGRSARENRSPQEYLSLSYYEIWLAGLEQLVLDTGLVTPEELASGDASGPGEPVRVVAAADVPAMLASGGPADREAPRSARFEVGAHVRTVNIHPRTHTRLPRYARGHLGVIERVHGCHVFPDSHAYGPDDPQWLYSVRFDATELWGPDADPSSTVSIDAFEPYLEPV